MKSSSPLTAQALVRTYDHPSYADAWDAVTDYEQVMEYTAKHPNAGRTKVGNALELPPERVRGWMNGGKPDCVRGIHTAGELGWLDREIVSDDPVWMAFVTAVSWIFSGGSISTADYRPRFAVEQDTETAIQDALQTLSVGTEIRHEDLDSRASEVVPASHAPLLGRALAVLGAPVGQKMDQDLSLPSWLQSVSTPAREHFAEIYLQNRGTEHEGKATFTLGEDRSDMYRKELAAFLSETLNANVTTGDRWVTVPAAAVKERGLIEDNVDRP